MSTPHRICLQPIHIQWPWAEARKHSTKGPLKLGQCLTFVLVEDKEVPSLPSTFPRCAPRAHAWHGAIFRDMLRLYQHLPVVWTRVQNLDNT